MFAGPGLCTLCLLGEQNKEEGPRGREAEGTDPKDQK